MAKIMTKCLTCSNAIYDALWGEFVCRISQSRVYDRVCDCVSYEEGDPEMSERNKDYDMKLYGNEE